MTHDATPPVRLRLAEILDLKAAAPLRSEILACEGNPIELDASGVQRLGGLCLQVLLAARASWDSAELPFAVVEPSTAFTDAAALLGAQAAFERRSGMME